MEQPSSGVGGLQLLLSVVTLLFLIGLVVFVFTITGAGLSESEITSSTTYYNVTQHTDGMVLHLDGSAFTDEGPNSLTITNHGAEIIPNDMFGSVFYLDGTDRIEMVDLGGKIYNTGGSVSFWANATGSAGTEAVTFGHLAGGSFKRFRLGIKSAYLSWGFGGSAGGSGSSNVSFNQWQFYTVVWTNSGVNIYVDGIHEHTVGYGVHHPFTTADTLVFGRNEQYGSNYYIGELAEIRFYNRTLNSTEVIDLMDNPYLEMSNVTYGQTSAGEVMTETTDSIAGVTEWFGIIIVISAMVVLILLTILIIYAIRQSGMMGSA